MKKNKRYRRLQMEQLETRYAPAAVVVAYTDIDGDGVRISDSSGTLGLGDLTVVGGQLQRLNLTAAGFAGANITFNVTKVPGGDGLANIGYINAGSNNLGTVVVKGDLGAIDAGSDSPSTPAIKNLNVRSMGVYGLATQGGVGDLRSDIFGALGTLTVKRDLDEAIISVTDSDGGNGKIGSVFIGGSVIGGVADQSGSIIARQGVGVTTIKGDIRGGAGVTSGAVTCTHDVAGVTVGGSLLGGPSFTSGVIFSSLGAMGSVRIGGSIVGGTATFTGRVFAKTNLASVTVGGSVIGGPLNDSGKIHSDGNIGPINIGHDVQGGAGTKSGQIQAGGDIDSVTIGGSLIGGTGEESGEIFSDSGDIGAVSILLDVQGGSGAYSGEIFVDGTLGSVTVGGSLIGNVAGSTGAIRGGELAQVRIGHDVRGGAGIESGEIISPRTGVVTIGGSVVGGAGNDSGVVVGGELGTVRIGHDVHGGSGSRSGFIGAQTGNLASVTIGGSLSGGTGDGSGIINCQADMGTVKIGHDLQGGAGFDSGLILSNGNTASVIIGGSLNAGSAVGNAAIYCIGDLGVVTIGHDVRGGTAFSGFISVEGKLAAVTIGGSLLGGSGISSGVILGKSDIGSVRIAHDLIGGSVSGNAPTLEKTGYIESLGSIDSVFIGGSVIAGSDFSPNGGLTKNASIRAEGAIGSIAVRRNVLGSIGAAVEGIELEPIVFSAAGLAGVPHELPTIGGITIGGRVERTNVLAGFDRDLFAVNRCVSIGTVDVGGDWIAGNIVVGVENYGNNGVHFGGDDNVNFGDTNDHLIIDGTTCVPKIDRITIRGVVVGSAADGDHFGFVANQIGSVTILGVPALLHPGVANDLAELSPTTGDATIREV